MVVASALFRPVMRRTLPAAERPPAASEFSLSTRSASPITSGLVPGLLMTS